MTETCKSYLWRGGNSERVLTYGSVYGGERAGKERQGAQHSLYLIVVLHELDDDPDVVAVVLDGDDSHDVGGVLCVRVLAVLVGEHQARVRLVHLQQRDRSARQPAVRPGALSTLA